MKRLSAIVIPTPVDSPEGWLILTIAGNLQWQSMSRAKTKREAIDRARCANRRFRRLGYASVIHRETETAKAKSAKKGGAK